MIIICKDQKEYEETKEALRSVSEKIDLLCVKNPDSYMYYAPGSLEASKTCTFDLIKTKIGSAYWFCTLQTLIDTLKNYFDPPEVNELSLKEIAKKFDIPVKSIKIVD
jgi:hypothetical protein